MVQFRSTLRLIWVSALLVVALCGCGPESGSAGTATAATAAASSTAQDQASGVVSAAGVVVPYKRADLSFKALGRVEQIFVAEGDQVAAGQQLARLDARDLEQAVLQAQARLRSAQAELAKAKAGSRPEEVASAEAALAIAQAGAKAADGAVAVSEGRLARAEADLQDTQDAVQVAQGNLAAAQAVLSSAQASLQKLLAGATKREIEIAQQRVKLAEKEWAGLRQKRDEFYNVIEGDIAAAQSKLGIARLQLAQLEDPPRPEDVAMLRAQVAQAEAEVQTNRSQLAQARIQVLQAQAGVETAKAQLAQTQAEVGSAQARTAQAQAERDLVKAGTRAEDIAIAEAAVAQGEAALAEAQNALEDAVLKAPFAGTIGAILVDEGELVQPQATVVRLGDLTHLRVDTEDLSEVDVDQVQLGQEAVVTVDALGGETFQGEVSEVAPVATDYRGDTVYTVTTDLGVGPESGLRWGMSTFVEIQVQ